MNRRSIGCPRRLSKDLHSAAAAFLLLATTAAAATGPPEEVFSDGFESGDTCAWGAAFACLSDDFEDGDFDGWELLHPEEASLSVVTGALRIEPVANSLWFNGSSSIFLWRSITGDFRMTAPVTARRLPPNDAAPPLPTIRLGGVMARNPDTGTGENYVFIVLGADVDDLSVEAKTTTNSVSTFDGMPVLPSGAADLRLCRLGSDFHYLYREAGGVWQSHPVIPSVNRPDLPPSLQVGPMAYANQSDPDLQILVEEILFAPATSFADCTADEKLPSLVKKGRSGPD